VTSKRQNEQNPPATQASNGNSSSRGWSTRAARVLLCRLLRLLEERVYSQQWRMNELRTQPCTPSTGSAREGAFARGIADHDYLGPRLQANGLQGLRTLDDEIFSIDNALQYKVLGRRPGLEPANEPPARDNHSILCSCRVLRLRSSARAGQSSRARGLATQHARPRAIRLSAVADESTPEPPAALHDGLAMCVLALGSNELLPSMRSALDGVSGPLGPGQFLTQGADTHTHGQCPRGSSVFSRQPASSALKATHSKFVMGNPIPRPYSNTASRDKPTATSSAC